MIALIAALAKNRVIGRDGTIPWSIPEDLHHFRDLTMGSTVIMGRRTYEDIGQPLPGRMNIVVSGKLHLTGENLITVPSLDDALAAVTTPDVFIIGGAALYREALPRADILYLTEIDAEIDGDTHFPEFDPADFRRIIGSHSDEPLPYTFVTYERIPKTQEVTPMRRFIIDTDTASDDAAALMLAALDGKAEILGVTTVVGNVSKYQSAANALATLEVCGCSAPVYMGAEKPLFHERKETISVHGADGMGDCDLIHPTGKPDESMPSYRFILEQVKKYPDEIELVVLGPVTNIAIAMLAEPDTMKHVKRIWSMGTPGLGVGNASPVAEFNVYIDAEAYAVMLNSGVPVTIIGFDLCLGDIQLDLTELDKIAHGNPAGRFLERAVSGLLRFNQTTRNSDMIDLPDAVAMACAVWPDFVVSSVDCHCTVCTEAGETYGQVIFYQKGRTYESMPKFDACAYNVTLITAVKEPVFTERFLDLLTK